MTRGFAVCTAVAILAVTSAHAATCETEKTIPADQKQVAAGVATADDDYEQEFRGGQVVYVRVRNDTIHLTPMEVGIGSGKTQDGNPIVVCMASILLPPQTTVIWRGGVFGNPSIPYVVGVSTTESVDVAQMTVTVFSKP